ncbi:bifunctional glutamate N-acetyltransferase/amino-acid acetyltransferase ArgJ [Glutamicibacter soli]|uniref:Arginine biosynthesis bifunctional protein ArgJ n=1 Tax=Glutamicibacter soli TaxID=453836 RepID=A0A365YK81_9MICC|nr:MULTISPECIES: bifunctional glutamate N-acetyltransferase/amino-acid acetyltransferase ArgJ [Micrococcaceae]ALQ32417.1 N-acetylglutamate synthase [Arthrobacter sp. YC-RL1]KLI87462.1 N-acetylglutamate synthase [Arthrobacter sp. YC-RL1]NAZ17074.1 bifunctional glutamate N-acetyltransferase/amino-acid acetyltransferase ArgJ [Glutamicibacter soli]RBM03072.1 bifunctional glutamate N-acetyltransferase/amino-acid acetyltransferase ArgJ [Glutamicibacter soli]
MGVTAPAGFTAAGVPAGLKSTGKNDVVLVRNLGPDFAAAGVFTSNRVAAAPVKWSRQVLADGRIDAVLLNSGGANACTGAEGFGNTHRSAEYVADLLKVSAGDVAVASTGLIGQQLPMDKLLPGIAAAAAALAGTQDASDQAAAGIMTTDSVSKQVSRVVGDSTTGQVIIGGMAKGAGMLAPALATMLVVLTTDAALTSEQLDAALRSATAMSFDRADSDGCMSTNDTVLLLASGASGITPDAAEFTAALTDACQELAARLIDDAEGAEHTIAIRTFNAATEADALEVSKAVSRSNLVKTAVFGKDPNWGRVLSEVGTTQAAFEPDELNVAINGVWVCKNGGVGEDRSLVSLEDRNVTIDIDLNAGTAQATVLTNDLTHDYVHENSAYSS